VNALLILEFLRNLSFVKFNTLNGINHVLGRLINTNILWAVFKNRSHFQIRLLSIFGLCWQYLDWVAYWSETC